MTQKTNTTALRRAGRLGAFGAAAAALAAGVALTAAPANAATASANTWDKLANCEASGNWSANTGNGFSGGLQFTPSTWKAYGGSGSAHNASKAEQIRVAKKVQASQGWGAWPACSAKLGLRGSAAASAGVTSAGSHTGATVAKKSTYAAKATTKSYTSYSSKAVTKSYAPVQRTAAVAPAAAAPSYALPSNVKDSGKNIVVKSGDSLATIAQKQGLDNWLSLYALNKDEISNPDLILVGQHLDVPTK